VGLNLLAQIFFVFICKPEEKLDYVYKTGGLLVFVLLENSAKNTPQVVVLQNIGSHHVPTLPSLRA
jgi:hypothetical protein